MGLHSAVDNLHFIEYLLYGKLVDVFPGVPSEVVGIPSSSLLPTSLPAGGPKDIKFDTSLRSLAIGISLLCANVWYCNSGQINSIY